MRSWRIWLKWIAIFIALVAIGIISEGVHDIAIEHLGAPYPAFVGKPVWVSVVGDGVILGFFVMFCRLARDRLDKAPLAVAMLIVGLLDAMLCETFRLQIILYVLADGVGGLANNLTYAAVSLLPGLLDGLAVGILGVIIARYAAARSFALAAVALVAATAVFYAVRANSGESATILQSLLRLRELKEIIQPPYRGFPELVVLVTFTEAALAAFLLVALAWGRLPGSTLQKIGLGSVLILGMRGRLGLFFLNSFWVDEPFGVKFWSTGQFFLEVLVLGVLVSCLWAYVSRRSTSAGSIGSAGRLAHFAGKS